MDFESTMEEVKPETEEKPPLWQLFIIWTAPIWWTATYIMAVALFSRACLQTDFISPGLIPREYLSIPLYLVPVLTSVILLNVKPWFKYQLGPLIIVWLLLSIFAGLSPNRFSQILWKASGCPTSLPLEALEKRVTDLYLPGRCNEFLNGRATRALILMKEKPLCHQTNPKFLYRLLVLGPGFNNSASCFHERLTEEGTLLKYTTISSEPEFPFADSESGNESKIALQSRKIEISRSQVAELNSLLEEAESYYAKNKYISYEMIPAARHYLLEFQVKGRYYYYDFEGKDPGNSACTKEALLPQFLKGLLARNRSLCKDYETSLTVPQ